MSKRQAYKRAVKKPIIDKYKIEVVLPFWFGHPNPEKDKVVATFTINAKSGPEAVKEGVSEARARGIEMPFHLRVHAVPCPDCKDDT